VVGLTTPPSALVWVLLILAFAAGLWGIGVSIAALAGPRPRPWAAAVTAIVLGALPVALLSWIVSIFFNGEWL
jgi:hypothetical protein